MDQESRPGVQEPRRDEPLDLNRDAATKADLADAARWLDQRFGGMRTDIAALRKDIEAHNSMVSDHLIMIRADVTRLQRHLDEETDDTRGGPVTNRRGLERPSDPQHWLLPIIGIALAFGFGLLFPVDLILDVLPSTWWAGP